MKKIVSMIVLIALCALGLCGCSLNEKPISLESSMEIPEDGVVPASVFAALQKENKVIVFAGKSGDTTYEWTIFGSDITTPQDIKLEIEVTEDAEGKLVFEWNGEETLDFPPLLSLYSAHLWDADSAVVYQMSGNTETPVSSASVTGKMNSTLNFTLIKPGIYKVVSEKIATDNDPDEDGEAARADKQASGKKATDGNPAEGGEAAPADGQAAEKASMDGDALEGGEAAPADRQTPGSQASDSGSKRVISDGKQTGQDQYLTDPVPEGKPMPVEPEHQEIDTGNTYTCTFSIECATILNNLNDLNSDKLDAVPQNGVIYPSTKVTFYEGESVYDVLQRVCSESGIHMEASWTPIYNSAYVEGIHNLYEFDCGSGSGWMYRVNGWYPNYGCSRYQLAQGDVVEWRYTCDLGADIGGGYAMGE